MKKLNHYILSLILSVISALLIIALSMLGFVRGIALSPDFYTDIVKRNNIADSVYSSLESYFDSSSASSGIPKEVCMNAVDRDKLEQAICANISNYIGYLKNSEALPSYDYTALEESITKYFEDFAAEKGIEITDSYKAQLQNTIAAAEAEINSQTDVFMIQLMAQSNMWDKLVKLCPLINIMIYGTAAVLAVCVILLMLLNRKGVYGLFYWLFISAFSAAVTVIVPCVVLKVSDYFKGLVIRTDYIYKAVTETLSAMLDKIIVIQCAVLVCALILAALYLLTGREKKAQ